jgi:hypothetical protein
VRRTCAAKPNGTSRSPRPHTNSAGGRSDPGASRSPPAHAAPRGRCSAPPRRTRRVPRGQVRAQELVHPRRGPALGRVRQEAAHDAFDEPPGRRLQEPELGADEAQERGPRAVAQPGQRRREQRDAIRALGRAQPDLQRHAATHAVAHEVRPLDRQRVEQRLDAAGEEPGVVAGGDRLVRVAEPEQVDRDDAMVGGEGRHRREERRLRGAQAVQQDDWRAAAGLHRRDRPHPRLDVAASAGRRAHVNPTWRPGGRRPGAGRGGCAGRPERNAAIPAAEVLGDAAPRRCVRRAARRPGACRRRRAPRRRVSPSSSASTSEAGALQANAGLVALGGEDRRVGSGRPIRRWAAGTSVIVAMFPERDVRAPRSRRGA